MEKKFQIDLDKNRAKKIIAQKDGVVISEEYDIFRDAKGMKIFVANKVIYLTQENSEVI